MNRNQLIAAYLSFLQRFNLKAEDVPMSAGSACVVYGVRQTTGDLDLDVPAHVFDVIKCIADADYRVVPDGVNGPTELITFEQIYDLHRPRNIATVVIDGVCLYTLDELLNQKRSLLVNRPARKADKIRQDKQDIAALIALINQI